MAQNELFVQFRKKLNGSIFGAFSGLAQATTRFEATLQKESNLRHKAYYTGAEDYDNMTVEVDLD